MGEWGKIRRRQWHPTPGLLSGKSHGRRSLVGCSPGGREELDRTERLHFHFSLSCIGEGNGNPLQCSCLEDSSDRGAWWAAICRVTQSRTRLKRLSSSSRGKISYISKDCVLWRKEYQSKNEILASCCVILEKSFKFSKHVFTCLQLHSYLQPT